VKYGWYFERIMLDIYVIHGRFVNGFKHKKISQYSFTYLK
jgi:hypothetical protein